MTLSRGELVLQRFVLRTQGSGLRQIWKALYAGIAHGIALWMGREGATIFLAGSLARGEPIYGLSDIDLVAVAPDQTARERLVRSAEQMYRAVPMLRRLAAHVWLYDRMELEAVASSPFPTYGLDGGLAAFNGREAIPDPMGLLERPGLRGPAGEWRRLRGRGAPLRPARDRQDERLAAWLELQYRWKWAYLMDLDGPSPAVAARTASLVADTARIWLWLVAEEDVPGRRAPLRRASQLLESERETLGLALWILERISESLRPPITELWRCFVGLTRQVAEHMQDELAAVSSTDVELDDSPVRGGLPLRDWRGMVLPPVDWSNPELPVAPVECFTIESGDPADPGAVARTARANRDRVWRSLRSGPLLARPNLVVWGEGRLRGLETPASDPVSFALLEGRGSARFPDVGGWSALDRALRAVAEHRAWLHQEVDHQARRPPWVGVRPLANWNTPASLSLLLSAARAALFLASVEDGRPRLTLTDEATVHVLVERDPAVAEAAAGALATLRACEREPCRPDRVGLMRLRATVIRLRAYATSGQDWGTRGDR